MLELLQNILPSECFRGRLWSNDILQICKLLKVPDDDNDSIDATKHDENDSIDATKDAKIEEIRSNNNLKLSEMNTAETNKLYKELYHLTHDIEPPLTEVKNMGEKKK